MHHIIDAFLHGLDIHGLLFLHIDHSDFFIFLHGLAFAAIANLDNQAGVDVFSGSEVDAAGITAAGVSRAYLSHDM